MRDLKNLDEDIRKVQWEFPPDSILCHYTETTPCREIFLAVCGEIGKFFSPYGFKYTPSKPKLELKQGELTFQVIFASSGSNMPGSYVNLEINCNIYSHKLAQLDRLEEYNAKGFILGCIDFSYRFQRGKTEGTVTVELLDGTIVDERLENIKGATYIRNRNYNVYGLTPDKFLNIARYINDTAINPFSNLMDKKYLIEFINNSASGHFGRDTSRLIKFVQLSFVESGEIIDAINKKVAFYSKI
jgi:hypothetical protein